MMMVDLPSVYCLALPRDSDDFISEKRSYHVLARGAPEDVVHGKACEIDWELAKKLQHYEFAKPPTVEDGQG